MQNNSTDYSSNSGEASIAAGALPGREDLLRRAYILEQIASAPSDASAGSLNKKIPAAARKLLNLTANKANCIRHELASLGYLKATRRKNSAAFTLTDSGRHYLAGLERPTIASRASRSDLADEAAIEAAITDEVRAGQISYLLLQLLEARGGRMSKSEANRFRGAPRASLSLRVPLANYRRKKLADRGFLKIETLGRTEEYVLTPDGRDYLAANCRHYEPATFKITGKALNELINAARELAALGKEAFQNREAPSPAELEHAILEEFQSLFRERHSRSGLVPIHEVRQSIAARFGSATARHEFFDEIILGLWRQKRLGLESISDLSGVTEQQLNESIPGVNGTLFYLEAAREPAPI